MTKPKLGRPPIGKRAMTESERQAASVAARRERGLVQIKAWVNKSLHQRLKKMAEKSGESVSEIIAKGLASSVKKTR
jgi:predicted HicB family RNase H-like nuclease